MCNISAATAVLQYKMCHVLYDAICYVFVCVYVCLCNISSRLATALKKCWKMYKCKNGIDEVSVLYWRQVEMNRKSDID